MPIETSPRPLLPEPILVTEQRWSQNEVPWVSVSCITYNHAPYIRDAMEGFLMQRTTFPVEILIHDDASTDGTIEIIKEYEKQYPHLIFPMYQSVNRFSQGIKITPTYQIPRARGKYIALCEGDDYWTDPLKLQKQFDFLEKHPEYVLCFHKVRALEGSQVKEDEVMERRYLAIENKREITVLDLLKHRNFIHTGSVMFRNIPIPAPFEIEFSPVGDYFLFILLSEKGPLFRLDETMGIYRRGSGHYSTLSALDMQRKVVQYHIAILSYLSDDRHKRIFLQKTLDALSDFETLLKAHSEKREMAGRAAKLKSLIKTLLVRKKT
ncbi:MAG: glycosyltransferase [Chloroflexi bacterium]|nr:glycosyltransferase [Chloroflexota bacterium]